MSTYIILGAFMFATASLASSLVSAVLLNIFKLQTSRVDKDAYLSELLELASDGLEIPVVGHDPHKSDDLLA